MISTQIYLSDPSTTSAEQLAPMGAVRTHLDTTYGFQQYRMVKATVALLTHVVVEYSDGLTSAGVKASAAAMTAVKIAGITQNAIPVGHYGWVCCSGTCTVTAASDVVAGEQAQTVGTIGSVDGFSPTAADGLEEAIIGVFPAIIDISVLATGPIRLSGLL